MFRKIDLFVKIKYLLLLRQGANLDHIQKMGERFSKPRTKSEYLQGYLAAMKKKREQVLISKSGQSFNGKVAEIFSELTSRP